MRGGSSVKKSPAVHLLLYSLAHFLVDFLCAYMIFRKTRESTLFYTGLLLYNFCAFAVQMPLGILADRAKRCGLAAVWGCVILLPALVLPMNTVLLTLTAGLGNALFHIGGGTAVLRENPGRHSEPGIFVSTGALGLWLGTLAGKSASFPAWLPVLAVTVMMFLLLPTALSPVEQIPALPDSDDHSDDPVGNAGPFLTPFLCLMLVVALRSWLGLILQFDWKALPLPGFLLIAAVAAGKALGGLLADRFGSWKTVLCSLTVSGILFFFSGHPLPGIAAVLLFNMTMPLTLTALAQMLPGQPGFSFGLLTFSLFLGFIPVWLALTPSGFRPVLYGLLAFLSLGLMAVAWKKRRWLS